MVRSEKKVVIAYSHRQALHFAKQMEWARSEWTYISRPEQLKGFYGVVLYDVRVPGYRATREEESKMADLRDLILCAADVGRIAKHNVVNLK